MVSGDSERFFGFESFQENVDPGVEIKACCHQNPKQIVTIGLTAGNLQDAFLISKVILCVQFLKPKLSLNKLWLGRRKEKIIMHKNIDLESPPLNSMLKG